jgi:hypothetical protein
MSTRHSIRPAAAPDCAGLRTRCADVVTCTLGEDRCDVEHPVLDETWCSMPVGHGGRHQCCTRDGEGHEWS